jgi:integrase
MADTSPIRAWPGCTGRPETARSPLARSALLENRCCGSIRPRSLRTVAKLGLALAAGARGNLYELLANAAAYSGLRWGELAALTIPQIDSAARAISVDRKIVEVAGQLYLEAPKNRRRRRTICPRRTPAGYPLAARLASRIEEARAEQEAGANPLGLIFPSVKGRYWRSSNFNRRVLAPAYQAVRWRDAEGDGGWTWHRCRLCRTASAASATSVT